MQQLWANLLANALDPKYAGKITRNFASILADMEPVDARIFDMVLRAHKGLSDDKKSQTLFVLAKVSANVGLLSGTAKTQ